MKSSETVDRSGSGRPHKLAIFMVGAVVTALGVVGVKSLIPADLRGARNTAADVEYEPETVAAKLKGADDLTATAVLFSMREASLRVLDVDWRAAIDFALVKLADPTPPGYSYAWKMFMSLVSDVPSEMLPRLKERLASERGDRNDTRTVGRIHFLLQAISLRDGRFRLVLEGFRIDPVGTQIPGELLGAEGK